MAEKTYNMGFGDGWKSVAGKKPRPADVVYPPEDDARNYEVGVLYGRAEAEMRLQPDSIEHPRPTGL